MGDIIANHEARYMAENKLLIVLQEYTLSTKSNVVRVQYSPVLQEQYTGFTEPHGKISGQPLWRYEFANDS